MHAGIRSGGLTWCIAVRIIARAVCYDGGKNGIEKILIFLKLQVEQEREGDRATSRSDQSSLWPQCIRLEAIVRAFATSQLSCSWVGRWNDALVLCCAAWCLLFLLFVLLLSTHVGNLRAEGGGACDEKGGARISSVIYRY